MIKENLEQVEQKIAAACQRAGRKREEVTLVAVSKTKPLEAVEEVLDLGILEFGENKVQEMMEKQEHIKSPVHWHMIGHLQTNKVKYIVDKVVLIHSVDSLKLAAQIQKEAEKKNVVVDILIPSVIPTQPIIIAALPACFSSLLYFFGANNVASPMPSGGVQIATPTPPIK